MVFVSTTFDFKNIVANTNGTVLDIGPLAKNLSADVDIKSFSISKDWVRDELKVTLAMVVVMLTLPSGEVGISITSYV
jgi:hypothetical protein